MHKLDRLYERADHLEGEGVGHYSTGELLRKAAATDAGKARDLLQFSSQA